MQSLSFIRSADLLVRPALAEDLSQLQYLAEMTAHVHLNLDWWTLEDWVGNPAFLVAQHGSRIAGLALGTLEASQVAWLRGVVVDESIHPDTLLHAALPPLMRALQAQGAEAIVCLAWADWLSDILRGHGFTPFTQVISLRLDNWGGPGFHNYAAQAHSAPQVRDDLVLREAKPDDIETIVEIDHAAFEPEWWYSQTTLARARENQSRFVVAEHDSQLVGYGFGTPYRTQAHVTRLAVRPQYQRQGVGARILQDITRFYLDAGVEAITLNTQSYNGHALQLYRSFGFLPVGLPVVMWRRVLTSP